MVGGSIVANYGVAGAKLAPVTMTGSCLEAQANAAAADGTVDKSLVSDVLVIMGVNNLNGSHVTYLPDEATCRNLFEGLRMYQHARYWYAANSKRCVNTDQAAWTFYQRFMQCANDAGFAAARHSPMWHWGATTCGTPTTPAPSGTTRDGSSSRAASHSTNPTGRRGASRHTAFWYRPHR